MNHYYNDVCHCFLERDSDVLWEVTNIETISHGVGEMNSRKVNQSDVKEQVREASVIGVLNPTTCLHLGDVILFTVDTRHYPQYDV